MINRAGQVIGVVFGAAVDDDDTGFVMTTDRCPASWRRSVALRRCPPAPACTLTGTLRSRPGSAAGGR